MTSAVWSMPIYDVEMPDSRPLSSVDAFLMARGFEPTTPVRDLVGQPQHQEPQAQHVPNPNRFGPSGRYFIRDDQLQGPRTTVVEAGKSQFADVVNPLPDRTTFESEMEQRNALAWEVERLNRLSGSHTINDARSRAREGWESHLVRDQSGRLRTDWSRVGADVPRDPAGRPHATTDVDSGRFQPGGDIF